MWEMCGRPVSPRDTRTLGSDVEEPGCIIIRSKTGLCVRRTDSVVSAGRGRSGGALEGRAKKVRPSIGKGEERSGVEEGRWPPPGEDSAQSDTASADAPFGTSLPGGFTRFSEGGRPPQEVQEVHRRFTGVLRRFPCFSAPPSWTGSARLRPRLPAGTGTAWREVAHTSQGGPPARRSGPAGCRREHAAAAPPRGRGGVRAGAGGGGRAAGDGARDGGRDPVGLVRRPRPLQRRGRVPGRPGSGRRRGRGRGRGRGRR